MRTRWKVVGTVAVVFVVLGVWASLLTPGGEKPTRVTASVSSAPMPRAVPELAATLARFRDDPSSGKRASADGEFTETWHFELPGSSVATFTRLTEVRGAWRFGLEGMRCDAVEELGTRVRKVSPDAPPSPMRAIWYHVEGGPLDGVYVKVFGDGSTCAIMPGTHGYWDMRGETLPAKR